MASTTHSSFNLESFLKTVSEQRYPPVDRWNPDFCGDIDMRIASDGTWFYMGTPITRQRMVRLFSTVLRKDEDGKTYLVTPVEKIGIQVEDAHFIAIGLEVLGEGDDQVLSFRTNVEDKIVADADHPIRVVIDPATEEPRPYVAVRGRLEALISRSVFYQLVDMAEQVATEHGTELVVKSAKQSFSLGSWSEA